jgi:hypothetical protein
LLVEKHKVKSFFFLTDPRQFSHLSSGWEGVIGSQKFNKWIQEKKQSQHPVRFMHIPMLKTLPVYRQIAATFPWRFSVIHSNYSSHFLSVIQSCSHISNILTDLCIFQY